MRQYAISGTAIIRRSLEEGALLVAVDRFEWGHDLKQERVLTLTADVERHAECAHEMAAAKAHFGRIDILINNVSVTIWAKPFEHYAEHEIEAQIRRSLFPTLWCCHSVLPFMLKQGSGAFVNVSSIATRSMNRVPYGAAKGGVNALTACLAFENAGRGIRINATALGGTEAPPRRIPRNSEPQSDLERGWYQQIVDQTIDNTLMKRYGTIDEQAGAILFLASDDAAYIIGVTLPVGGGDVGVIYVAATAKARTRP
jgi:dihydroxycyclohexadiene carboxylate dehydrogenase